MIVPDQMQYTVNQKLIKAILHADVCRMGFLFCGFNRYDHITEQIWIYIIKMAFTHGKSNNIRRAISVQIINIQDFDLLVINKKDG